MHCTSTVTWHPAPIYSRIPTTTLLFSSILLIMSSPNTRFAAAALKSAPKNSTSGMSSTQPSSNDGVQLVTIGKDTIAIPVPTMATINDPTYLKAACFNALSSTAYGLLDTYSASSVMMFVNQQLPINTTIPLLKHPALPNLSAMLFYKSRIYKLLVSSRKTGLKLTKNKQIS